LPIPFLVNRSAYSQQEEKLVFKAEEQLLTLIDAPIEILIETRSACWQGLPGETLPRHV